MTSVIAHKNMFNLLSDDNINASSIVSPFSFAPPQQARQQAHQQARTPQRLSFTKTRPCNEAINTGHCHRGSNCDYANFQEELVDPPCGFRNCYRRHQSTLKQGQTICTLRHEDESVSDYRHRVHKNIDRLPYKNKVEDRRVVEDRHSDELTIRVSADKVSDAIKEALKNGFTNFNIELI